MATNDELIAEIQARGGEVPTKGSGTNDAVVKADLEAALEDLPEVRGPRLNPKTGAFLPAEYDLPSGRTRKDL